MYQKKLPKLFLRSTLKLTFILLFTTSFSFLSCQKQDLDPANTEIVLIDITDPGKYLYSNLETPELGWIEMVNGDGSYSFTVIDKEIIVQSLRPIKSAIYFEDTFDKKGEKLQVSTQNQIQMHAQSQDLIFEFTYTDNF